MSSSIDELQKRIAELQVAGNLLPKPVVSAINDTIKTELYCMQKNVNE
jgi:hypothetical protein